MGDDEMNTKKLTETEQLVVSGGGSSDTTSAGVERCTHEPGTEVERHTCEPDAGVERLVCRPGTGRMLLSGKVTGEA